MLPERASPAGSAQYVRKMGRCSACSYGLAPRNLALVIPDLEAPTWNWTARCSIVIETPSMMNCALVTISPQPSRVSPAPGRHTRGMLS